MLIPIASRTTSHTNTVTLTAPVQYQLFQRDGSDEASVTVCGFYTGSPTSIEVQVDSGAWTTLDSSPARRRFAGTVTLSAGEHTLTVRFANATGITASVANVRVGDLFGWIGQSNAHGRLTNGQSYSGTQPASVYDSTGAWANLTDDYSMPDTSKYSVLPLLATLIEADQSVPVGFIAKAEGGTGLGAADPDWAEGGTYYVAFVALTRASGTNDLQAILWYQGERDVVLGTTEAAYEAAEQDLIDNLQTDLGVTCKLISALVALYDGADRTQLDTIRKAKLDNWTTDTDILPGPTGHDQAFADGLHWATDAEAQTLANRWWRALAAALYSGTEAARGPQFASATRSGDVITVTFTGGEGNLQHQDDATGFRCEEDGSPVLITGAAANGTDAVDLTLDSTPTGTVTLSFASQNDASGATLSDSGTYPLPPEPFTDEAVTAP